MSEVLKSDTPYLDVFGVELRPKGRPAGAFLDYDTSLELPTAAVVEDRAEASAIRARVKARALAVLQAVHAEEMRAIYKAELKLEIARMKHEHFEGRPQPVGTAKKRKLLSDDDVKAMPGSGYEPGTTYWEWMKTMSEKDDKQWASEKLVVKANMLKLRKGGHHG